MEDLEDMEDIEAEGPEIEAKFEAEAELEDMELDSECEAEESSGCREVRSSVTTVAAQAAAQAVSAEPQPRALLRTRVLLGDTVRISSGVFKGQLAKTVSKVGTSFECSLLGDASKKAVLKYSQIILAESIFEELPQMPKRELAMLRKLQAAAEVQTPITRITPPSVKRAPQTTHTKQKQRKVTVKDRRLEEKASCLSATALDQAIDAARQQNDATRRPETAITGAPPVAPAALVAPAVPKAKAQPKAGGRAFKSELMRNAFRKTVEERGRASLT